MTNQEQNAQQLSVPCVVLHWKVHWNWHVVGWFAQSAAANGYKPAAQPHAHACCYTHSLDEEGVKAPSDCVLQVLECIR